VTPADQLLIILRLSVLMSGYSPYLVHPLDFCSCRSMLFSLYHSREWPQVCKEIRNICAKPNRRTIREGIIVTLKSRTNVRHRLCKKPLQLHWHSKSSKIESTWVMINFRSRMRETKKIPVIRSVVFPPVSLHAPGTFARGSTVSRNSPMAMVRP
jgi:hypothetical protein